MLPLTVHGTKLYLVGVAWPDWESAIRLDASVPPGALSVMMYHEPAIVVQASVTANLVLVGHTHGGQIALPFYGALITFAGEGKRFERGMYDLGGRTLHVSRGIGMEGGRAPRMRFFARPDISVIELTSPR